MYNGGIAGYAAPVGGMVPYRGAGGCLPTDQAAPSCIMVHDDSDFVVFHACDGSAVSPPTASGSELIVDADGSLGPARLLQIEVL
mmetsp:Transcript_115593/g.333957  ORF Transcript_115593/g.333957 Transcript_115593/m.333957 type:complete len:85 (-) Transcript_115593:232-486(-)